MYVVRSTASLTSIRRLYILHSLHSECVRRRRIKEETFIFISLSSRLHFTFVHFMNHIFNFYAHSAVSTWVVLCSVCLLFTHILRKCIFAESATDWWPLYFRKEIVVGHRCTLFHSMRQHNHYLCGSRHRAYHYYYLTACKALLYTALEYGCATYANWHTTVPLPSPSHPVEHFILSFFHKIHTWCIHLFYYVSSKCVQWIRKWAIRRPRASARVHYQTNDGNTTTVRTQNHHFIYRWASL